MKKLLAIVMVAVMVLSMSAVAFAEEDAAPAYTVSCTAQENEDGTVTIVVSAKGNIQAYDIGVVYKDAEPVKLNADEEDDNNLYVLNGATGSLGVSNLITLEDGSNCVVFTGAGTSGKLADYNGVLATFQFTKKGTFQIVTDTAIKGGVVTAVPDVTVEEYVAPTEAPTPEPTEDEATPAPQDNATPAPQTDATPAPQTNATPAPNGSNNAARTADVAPVAAMVTLVLMAGAALVVLKKRAAE